VVFHITCSKQREQPLLVKIYWKNAKYKRPGAKATLPTPVVDSKFIMCEG